jgi:cold shock CspA family protein
MGSKASALAGAATKNLQARPDLENTMQVPLQITIRNMKASDTLETYIRERAANLDEICETIISCRVVLEAPHKHKKKGRLYHVSINLNIPGETIVVNREPDLHQAHQDMHVVVRDAFNAVQRQLREAIASKKGQVKAHETAPQGEISVLYPMEDYGRIIGADGADIYFHRNSVMNTDFDKLVEGMAVRYAEEEGDAGPQASWVRIVE